MIYHTSAEIITTVKTGGLFGDALCFAGTPYGLGQLTDDRYVYEIDNDNFNFIEQYQFAYADWDQVKPFVDELAEKFDLDEDTALDLLCAKCSEWDIVDSCDADTSWFLQKHAYQCAVALGYDGLETEDEQGAMWMLSAKHVIALTPITYGEYQGR